MNYLAQEFVAENPAAYIEECLKHARTLYLDGFACDWTQPGADHDSNVDLCIEHVLSHLYFVVPEHRTEVATKLVQSWGSLDRSGEEPEEVPMPPPSTEPLSWPFPQ